MSARNSTFAVSLVSLACWAMFSAAAQAQVVISEKFTDASTPYDWQAIGGACLTAGNNKGTIPACVGNSYYAGRVHVGGHTGSMPDRVGRGALRLTNGARDDGDNGNNQSGAVYSKFDFPSDAGLNISFKSATYGGNGYQNAAGGESGADGLVFFLTDAAKVTQVNANTRVGAFGGSLGYSCAHNLSPANGLAHAYIGLGIDEFGNFGNLGDRVAAGYGPGPKQGRIVLKGAGNTTWAYLNGTWPQYYPSTAGTATRNSWVQQACREGYIFNRSGRRINGVPDGYAVAPLETNYRNMRRQNFPEGMSLYNQQATANPRRIDARAITYNLRLTNDAKLSLNYSINGGIKQPIMVNQDIRANNIALPERLRFGFAASTGVGSNIHEIFCFKVEPINSASSSAGLNVKEGERVQAGSQLYLAFYNNEHWSGQLTASDIIKDASTGTLYFSPKPNWDAGCALNGGYCDSTATTLTAISPEFRSIITWNGTKGVPFRWSSLSSSQKSALDSASASLSTSPALDFHRGHRTNEQGSGTRAYRKRKGILADIINSSPTWVGAPSKSEYNRVWKSALNPAANMPENAAPYSAFAQSLSSRTHMVYAGANDGMMHGFRAGSNDSAGRFNATLNDGHEAIAFMPDRALRALNTPAKASTTYHSPSYAHNAYVDATPGTGDLFFGGKWHTWLVSGLGGGSNPGGTIGTRTAVGKGSIFVLDITNPAAFSEGNAESIVVGEWSSDTLTCVNDANCKASMGNTHGTPVIRRMHDGNWALIYGNGFNSQSGKAGIFVTTVNQANGARSTRFIQLGTNATNNGVAYVTAVDLDDDAITDFLYAGDLNGGVWRVDVTSANPANWSASVTNLINVGQPISTSLAVAAGESGTSTPRIVVSFGTGLIYPKTLTSDAVPYPGAHKMYGVWDWNMGSWNSKSPMRYESLSSAPVITESALTVQTSADVNYTTANISGARTVTRNTVCWAGSSACATGNDKYGWVLRLPGKNEQLVYNPTVSNGLLFFNTTIQLVPGAATCDDDYITGYTMALSPLTGAAPKFSPFYDDYGKLVTHPSGDIGGISIKGIGSASVITADGSKYLVLQTVSGTGSLTKLNMPTAHAGRKTWVNLK